jgi:hypothetical protein
MAPLVGERVEFLPLIALRGEQFWAVNVLTLVDCLDESKSQILYSPTTPGKVLALSTKVFDPARVTDDPIFKLPQGPSQVLVQAEFATRLREAGLRGCLFRDPSGDGASAEARVANSA